ncbi:hypothetical protein [Burkholderia territorii]|uniref:hypothetical protein n=1 Tax=Burkholderia territorii TaxID=1503055 RepID=UPI0012D9EB7B|nr:hypothetical protein [Burkholderia territorii]
MPDRMIAPDAGATFIYRGRTYRVNSWICAAEPPPKTDNWIDEILFDAAYEREGVRFRYCTRDMATHVSGSGVAGCIAPIAEIEVIGTVDWPVEQLEAHRMSAILRGKRGQLIM